MEGTHKHKCKKCGFVWSHEDSCLNNTKAHTCAICFTVCWHWDDYPNDKAFPISCAKFPIGPDNPPPPPLSFEDWMKETFGIKLNETASDESNL